MRRSAARQLLALALALCGVPAAGQVGSNAHRACTYTLRRVEAWYVARCPNVTKKTVNLANAVHDALYTCKHATSRRDGVRIAAEFLSEHAALRAELCPGALEIVKRMARREELHARWTEGRA